MEFNVLQRTEWSNPALDDYDGPTVPERRDLMIPVRPEASGVAVASPNLVSSRLYDPANPSWSWSTHSPVLDLDFETRLVPSTTKGHYHLYLDGIEMNWTDYQQWLQATAKAGIIEQGYFEASVRRRMTCVRPPGVFKS